MTPEILTDLFRRTLTQELGLRIDCNNPRRISMLLHAVRAANPEFRQIEITVPEAPDTVFLVKKTVELQEPLDAIFEQGDLPDV